MTTRLGTQPVEDPDQLALIADDLTPVGRDLADAFKTACWTEAATHDGMVDPNRVRSRVHDLVGDFDPRRYSALWAPACGRDGYLVKTDVRVPISGTGSRGNTNKSVALRYWKGWHP